MAGTPLEEQPSSAGDDQLPVPGTWLVMAAAAAGAFIGSAVIFVWAPCWTPTERDLARSGPFLLWAGAIIAETMLLALALLPLITTFRRHLRARRRPGSLRSEVVPSALALVVLVVGLGLIPRFWLGSVPSVIPYLSWRLGIVMALAVPMSLLAAASMWLIRGRAELLAGEKPFTKAELFMYLDLRADLQALLGFLGGVIGLAVLASAALRQTVDVYRERAHEAGSAAAQGLSVTPQGVILYGLTLSLVVALVYVPTWVTVQRTGTGLRDAVASLPEPTAEDLEAKLRKRGALDELLGLRVSASASFRAGVAILAPLLTSLLTLLPGLDSS